MYTLKISFYKINQALRKKGLYRVIDGLSLDMKKPIPSTLVSKIVNEQSNRLTEMDSLILNDCLNQALIGKDRIKNPSSNKIKEFVDLYMKKTPT